jgi:hypothetical protein
MSSADGMTLVVSKRVITPCCSRSKAARLALDW